MRHSFARPVVLLAALAATLLASPVLADQHKDERVGFTIQTPKGWNQIPQKADEAWLIANYQSQKATFWTEKGGWTVEHKPDMLAIAFVNEQVKEEIRVKKDKDKEGNDRVTYLIKNPYKNYLDYMKRRYSGGGWYVDKEEQLTVGEVKVTAYEIRVDKLSYDGPKRIVTWVYSLPDVDVAVQFECLQDAWPKLKADVTRCHKSFKAIARSGESLVREVKTGNEISIFDAEKMTPEERKNWRLSEEKEFHDRAKKDLPDGWTAKQMGRFLVVYSCDEKFARSVAEQADAVWRWLDETFPEVGKAEYVRNPVLRVCKNEDEYRQFQETSDWSWDNLEMVTYQDYGGSTSYALSGLKRNVLNLWFNDRDRELAYAMPIWLMNGLYELVANSRVERGRLEFKRDDWNRDEVRNLVREGKAKHPRELVMITNSQLYEASDGWDIVRQSQAFVAFLVDGSAGRNARTKTVLPDYLAGLKKVQLALKTEQDAKKGEKEKRPKTEEEEEAEFKNQRQGYKNEEKRVLDEAFRSAFGAWTERDWEQFAEVYFQAIG